MGTVQGMLRTRESLRIIPQDPSRDATRRRESTVFPIGAKT